MQTMFTTCQFDLVEDVKSVFEDIRDIFGLIDAFKVTKILIFWWKHSYLPQKPTLEIALQVVMKSQKWAVVHVCDSKNGFKHLSASQSILFDRYKPKETRKHTQYVLGSNSKHFHAP